MSVYAGDVVEFSRVSADTYRILEVKRTRATAISLKSRTLVSLPVASMMLSEKEWPSDAPTTAAESITYGTVVEMLDLRLLTEHPGLWVCIKPDSNNKSMYAPLDHSAGRNVRAKIGHEKVAVRHLTYNS